MKNKIDRIIELLESIDQKLSSSSEKKKRKTPKERSHPNEESRSGIFWKSYSNAYFEKYKVQPERNAMINGMVANICNRVPIEDLESLGSAYLKQNDSWYLREMHHVRCLVKDCEILLTRMKSKVVMTIGKAQETERAAMNFNEAKSYLEKKHGAE
jgi:hypothetical protein